MDSNTLFRSIQTLASQWISPIDPGKFNQSLMDLGASVCTPRSPKCDICPINKICKVFKEVSWSRKFIGSGTSSSESVSKVHEIDLRGSTDGHLESSESKVGELMLSSLKSSADPRALNHQTLTDDTESPQSMLGLSSKSSRMRTVCEYEKCNICDPQYRTAAKRPDDYPLPKLKSVNKKESETGEKVTRIQKHRAVILYSLAQNDATADATDEGSRSLGPVENKLLLTILLKKRPPSGLLAHDWGPIILDEDNVEGLDTLLKELKVKIVEKKVVRRKRGTKDDLLGRRGRELGAIRHVFSHMTHDVVISAIECRRIEEPGIGDNKEEIDLERGKEEICLPDAAMCRIGKSQNEVSQIVASGATPDVKWVTLRTSTPSNDDLKQIGLVSKYMQKIVAPFFEAFNSGQLFDRNECFFRVDGLQL